MLTDITSTASQLKWETTHTLTDTAVVGMGKIFNSKRRVSSNNLTQTANGITITKVMGCKQMHIKYSIKVQHHIFLSMNIHRMNELWLQQTIHITCTFLINLEAEQGAKHVNLVHKDIAEQAKCFRRN